MFSEAPTTVHTPAWRVWVTVVLGLGLVALGGVLAAVFRPEWSWAPAWFVSAAPWAASIGAIVSGFALLGEVWPWARRLWRTVAGSLLILAGLAMLVLPGPGLVTIAAGLFVLSREYAWANRQYRRVTDQVNLAKQKAREKLAERRERRAHLPPARHESVVRNVRVFDGDRMADQPRRDDQWRNTA